MALHLYSDDLQHGSRMPQRYVFNGMGHAGENISPHLAWDNVPDGTKSFVLSVHDPDAPTGSGWWHWVVVNIPADARELVQGAGSDLALLPHGALQTRTDFGKAGYGGAAPPAGDPHHYHFTLYALDVGHLEVDSDASAALIGFMVHHHCIERATLTVTYP